ncbi:ABC transporter ATP-binding protein [Actinoalloteichus hymeniacidonis]|uniref:ABC-type multidrug transport system, ATPase component n=1 Tax=Actinoalloteichus hymeniacidonis TaxID=340345 RepID=A0AAC9HS90_9PSEU|nr:ATP-binding cassette domain-containing protein [Actinoalloteichus hymeniacidonis]AOS64026.1 ABC-type multidrug transport system, ATPase component [Actinoalloteichus hymeniacidonis]MBB5907912.1 ABC-2 type transport system ATP-binding protein [Actinoalloteichus hymeniacidonis]
MIETRGLTKRHRAFTVLDDLGFTAPAGQVTGFVGPNGSGKTSTLRIVVGLDRPSAGTATIDGRPLRDHPNPQRVAGILLNAGNAPAGMTARSHLRWLAAAGRIPDKRADDLLEEVGLSSVASRRIGALSLGMRGRLGIAAALLGDPGTLILDEPVNGLDPDGVRWIRLLMRRLAAEGRCVLVSSHLMAEMQQTADRVVVLGAGRLLAEIGLDELGEGVSLEDAYVALTADAAQYRAGSTERTSA